MGNKLKWISGTVLLGLAILLAGCGTTGSTPPPPPPPPPPPNAANLTIFATDAAADNVLAFKVDVTAISVTDASGKSTTLTTTPQTLEFRHLQLAPTLLLQAANLPSGQYNSISLSLANAKLAVFSSGTVTATNPQLTTSTVSIPLTNFSLPSGGTQGLALDFDLLNSISTNASGGYVVTPVVHPATVSAPSTAIELMDTIGQISAFPSSPTKSFDYQLITGAATARVVTDANTVFDGGITSFANLQVGQYVEVAGQFQSDGTFLAKFVELSSSAPGLRVQGIVSSVTTSASGTSLNMVVQN